MCSQRPNKQYSSIGAIILTNDDLAYWCMYASLGLNELTYVVIDLFQLT